MLPPTEYAAADAPAFYYQGRLLLLQRHDPDESQDYGLGDTSHLSDSAALLYIAKQLWEVRTSLARSKNESL